MSDAAREYYDASIARSVNADLRNGRDPEGRLGVIARAMEAEMRPTTEDLAVWRGRGRLMDYSEGDVIKDPAFQSWSTSWDTASSGYAASGRGTMLFVRIPKGTEAVAENAGEREVTLKNENFRVAGRIDSPVAGGRILADRLYVLEYVDGDLEHGG